jgi:hypothetical protein
MDAALYFELVDAVAKSDGHTELVKLAERIMATPMHPLERRVIERAIRARAEALAIQQQLNAPDLFAPIPAATTPVAARG